MAVLQAHSLVGRGQELERIDALLSKVGGGEFRTLVAHGPPGIGKTRLLSELAEMAQRRDFTVCHGHATEFERHLPFAMYAATVAPLAGATDTDLTALAAVVAGDEGSSATPARALDRYRLFHGVRRLLEHHAATRPVVMVLDDLQWADQSSVELTEYLLRRPPRGPLLMALAYRSAQAPLGVTDAAARLGPAAVAFELGPLGEADAAALMPSQPVNRQRLLYRTSGGNPLYLQALADTRDETLANLAGLDEDATPERALIDVLSAELRSLDPDVRHIVHAAAVAGDPVTLDFIAWIADRPEDSVDSAVDQLNQIGVVTTTGSRMQFRHPLVRAAAYWMSGPSWRTRAHARAADFLRERQGSLQVLAHHTERSARPGDVAAVATLAAAGEESLHTAPMAAARMLRAALRLMPDRADLAGRRVELQMALARALGVAGRLAESRQLLQEVMRAPGHQRVEAVAFASVVYRLLGQFDEAKALLTTEVVRAPDQGRPAAHALVELAAVELARKEPTNARHYALRALRAVAGVDDPALESAACGLLALCHLQRGEVADSGQYADRSAWLVDSASDAVLLPYIELVALLAWAEMHLQRYDTATRHLARGTDIAYRNGRSHSVPYLLIVSAALHVRRGRLAEAVNTASEAREASRLIHSPEGSAMANALLLRPVLWRDGPRAACELARGTGPNQSPRSGWWSDMAQVNLATVHLAAGDVAQGLAELGLPSAAARMGDRLDDPRWAADAAAYRWALGAIATAELDAVPEAHVLADRALAHARDIGLSHQLGAAHDALARVLARGDRLDEATREALSAAVYFADAGAPIEEAGARQLAAELYGRTGHLDLARDELGRAKTLYTACEASWLLGTLTRDERRLAASQPRRSSDVQNGHGLDVLTGREREVAELAGAGLTNREIAERLYLSQKTVEAHISRAFAKLGVRSRVGLARRLAVAQ